MPLILDGVAPGCDSYVWQLPSIVPGVAASWSYHNQMRSFKWRDGGVVKTRTAFTSHRAPDAFMTMLEAGARKGVDRPSSYGSFFHDCYHSPRVSGAARRAMSWQVPGAWEALLLQRGEYPGTWYRYDLRSAYLWALHAGLPDPDSYHFTERLHPRYEGCYLINSPGKEGAPYPYDRAGTYPILGEEIDRYGIRGRIGYGITWRRNIPLEPMLKAILDWPFRKEIGRAYWGRWAATAPLECVTYTATGKARRRWFVPSTFANPIWAHLILGRVRAKLYDVTRSARVARVYVDSVVVDRPLSGDGGLGSWRLEAEYSGLRVEHLHRITSIQENAVYAVA